ncbi:hypothetical protein CD191_16770 [Paenibacillus odorifer]|uniref:Uncharacterized protein n=1 Tax=Paenibacillus odorifer TaxID=189426 RepID=A0AAD0KKM1_9BACL|nr:hypothetical protein CD191_16770 [Paenibacillus odorifer]
MRWEDLKPGQSVRICDNHDSGFGGRCGSIVAIGTFIGISDRIGALIEIYEPLLIISPRRSRLRITATRMG